MAGPSRTSTAAVSTNQPVYIESGVISKSASIAFTTATASNVLLMVHIPSGATVLNVSVAGDASGGVYSGACLVGDGDDPNRYASSLSYSVGLIKTECTLSTGMNYTYTADDTVDITLSTITSGTETSVLKLSVMYSMDG